MPGQFIDSADNRDAAFAMVVDLAERLQALGIRGQLIAVRKVSHANYWIELFPGEIEIPAQRDTNGEDR